MTQTQAQAEAVLQTDLVAIAVFTFYLGSQVYYWLKDRYHPTTKGDTQWLRKQHHE